MRRCKVENLEYVLSAGDWYGTVFEQLVWAFRVRRGDRSRHDQDITIFPKRCRSRDHGPRLRLSFDYQCELAHSSDDTVAGREVVGT